MRKSVRERYHNNWMVITVLVLAALNAEAVEGIAVSIAYRYTEKCKYCPADQRDVPERNIYDATFWGKLVRYDISGGKTVSHDTLQPYLAHYPILSVDGSWVAFFLSGKRLDADNKLMEGATPPGIYVCKIDGSDLIRVLDYSEFGKNNAVYLDWPAGDWIYYHAIAKSEGEIWRVNVKTKAHEKVIDYIPASSETARSDMRRWNLNATATHAVAHISGAGDFDSKNAFRFPTSDWTTSRSGAIKDCNQSIGASGLYSAAYYGVGHNFIDIFHWNLKPGHSEKILRITVEEASQWAGVPAVGKGGEWINWSCNSDRWVLQQIGWAGHADNIDKGGSNAVFIDWVGKQAIRVTDNPNNGDKGANSTSYGNTSGDFWVKGGTAGHIQTRDGKWLLPEAGTSTGLFRSPASPPPVRLLRRLSGTLRYPRQGGEADVRGVRQPIKR